MQMYRVPRASNQREFWRESIEKGEGRCIEFTGPSRRLLLFRASLVSKEDESRVIKRVTVKRITYIVSLPLA